MCLGSLFTKKTATHTAQKMKFSIKDFFSKSDQTNKTSWNKSLMENFIYWAVTGFSGEFSDFFRRAIFQSILDLPILF